MAFTYSKIAAYTVGSTSVPSIAFLNIPQTYTDLLLKVSARTVRSAAEDGLYMVINRQTSTGFRNLEGNGSTASSVSTSAYGNNWVSRINGGTSTSSCFSNVGIYIPNYTSSDGKAISIDGVMENNSSTSYMNLTAAFGAVPGTAINSLSFSCNDNFAQYTTFHLYGIKAEI
jgi:hypothetical protein